MSSDSTDDVNAVDPVADQVDVKKTTTSGLGSDADVTAGENFETQNLGPAPRTIGSDTSLIPGTAQFSDSLTKTLVIKSKNLVDTKAAHRGAVSGNEPEYELAGILGVGGMGIVYDARQTSIDRIVALKMINEEAARNADDNSKFLAEAVVTGDLDHPNIVPIYDVGTNSQGHLFYSMKKVQGTPWMNVIHAKSLSENLDILMRTADAVGFAHARGIVHRDLKPENIMLGEFGEVLLMDWGIAFAMSGYRKSKTVSRSQSLGGTPPYMAPEMVTGPLEKIGPTSDIYLLGAILYEILTGHPPHLADTTLKCLQAAARNRIVPTEKTGELVDISLKAMSTNPLDRYQTVKEMQSAIREYQSHAESVVLSMHAEEDLKAAKESDEYQKFQRALFGFQQAYELWPGNKPAQTGVSAAELAYASSAMRKGDFDLGLSLLEKSNPDHASLRRELLAARDERVARQQRLDFLKRAAIGLTAAVLLIVTGSAIWIRSEQLKAKKEAENARTAEGRAKVEKVNAENEKQLAEKAKTDAEVQKVKADFQRDNAEKATKEANIQKANADKAANQARDSEAKAIKSKKEEEYSAYIARIGLAASQIEKNAFDAARKELRECKPELRHWEWGRLMFLCSQEVRTFKGKGESSSPLEALAVDREGRRMATGDRDGYAKIWDLESGRIVASLKHRGGYVNSVSFSPDGQLLATGSHDPDGFIQIWHIDTGVPLKKFKGHTDEVLSITFDREGSRLLTSSYDNTARLWEWNPNSQEAPKEITQFVGHSWWVWSAAFSRDEQRVITAGHDGTAIVWNLDGTKRSVFTGHRGPVFCARFSPDGKHAVSAGYDRRILKWNPDDIKPFDAKTFADDSMTSMSNFRSLEGHTDAVRSITFSPDGSLMLSGSDDNTLMVWSTDTNQAIKTFRGHGGQVKAALFVAGSQQIVSAAQDKTVREWSLAGRREIRTIQGLSLAGHTDDILSANYSNDEHHIVTASRDRTSRTWNAETAALELTLVEGHSFLVSNAVFFPGARRLVTAAFDNTARIWDVRTGGQVLRLDKTGRSAAVAVSNGDAPWVATGGENNMAQLWDAATGVCLKTFLEHKSEVTCVAFSLSNKMLATGDSKGYVKIWNIDEGVVSTSLEGHTRRISAIHFLDDSRVLTASYDNTISQWDARTGKELTRLILKHPDRVLGMRAIPGTNKLVSSCEDRKIRVWDIDKASVLQEIGSFESKTTDRPELGRSFVAIDVSDDGKHVLTANSAERTVQLWDLATAKEIQSLQLHGRRGPAGDLTRDAEKLWTTALFVPGTDDVLTVGVSDVRIWDSRSSRSRMTFNQHAVVASANYSPNGELIVTCGWDNLAKIWDTSGNVVRKLENGHDNLINTAVFSPDGKFILTASDDKTAKLWDADTGTIIRSFKGHGDRVSSANFSPNGEYVLTTSSDGEALLWRSHSGEFIRKFQGHSLGLTCGSFSKNGDWIVTGSEDNSARVWHIETGKSLLILEGHTAAVKSACFSPDSRRIITGSLDQSAKLWETKTGREILTLSRHTGEVTSVAFSPENGRQILTGSRDGTALIWLADDWHGSP